ncbi:MAG: hemolysin family protein [Alphaproteobacteria bacterium]|jgi:CBS domain containing-hemolysin-like protein|nr:hemolysin family protein [Alphaproteobacteria bacterium]MDP6238508.1 hemolysin family protein [Alphaproteobacteria bacterium]MDP7173065.1 hemolysin family protein [Alphaproteobacteria bacterium]MDP7233617.1 hemolysin family protein [Alphaproteobacteria bacterium]MDP7487072.1 hemolysin family protein [Alphaproteobacteria bacterium]
MSSDRQDEPGSAGERTLLGVLAGWLGSLTGIGSQADSLRQSVETLIAERDDDTALDEEERVMLLNLLKFGESRVEDVMVPRADIIAVPEGASLAEVVKLMSRVGHSRLPVYRNSLDDVIGMVHVQDLLTYWSVDEPFRLADVIRRLPFVPPSMPVQEMLREMRADKVHLAMVVDEHGGIDGLVTIEDLMEEIVGEIEDEHDTAALPLVAITADGSLEADARALILEIELKLGIDLLPADRDEDIETVGGLVFDLAGRVPAVGEVVAHPAGLAIDVLDADPRRVRKVRIRHADMAEQEPGGGEG